MAQARQPMSLISKRGSCGSPSRRPPPTAWSREEEEAVVKAVKAVKEAVEVVEVVEVVVEVVLEVVREEEEEAVVKVVEVVVEVEVEVVDVVDVVEEAAEEARLLAADHVRRLVVVDAVAGALAGVLAHLEPSALGALHLLLVESGNGRAQVGGGLRRTPAATASVGAAEMVQGGRWGGVVRQGGGHFQPAAPPCPTASRRSRLPAAPAERPHMSSSPPTEASSRRASQANERPRRRSGWRRSGRRPFGATKTGGGHRLGRRGCGGHVRRAAPPRLTRNQTRT